MPTDNNGNSHESTHNTVGDAGEHSTAKVGQCENSGHNPAFLGRGSTPSRDWSVLLQEYPQYGAEVLAVPTPRWDDDIECDAVPRGSERAFARFRSRRVKGLHLDSEVEMLGYTEPEIELLLGGTHVPGHTEGEERRMLAMNRAFEHVELLASDGPVEPSLKITDDLAIFMNADVGVKSLQFRGDQDEQYRGPLVQIGGGERFEALDSRLMHPVFEEGISRISQIASPVVRAATWAAFVAYQQPYFDGNKRVGRYSMNVVLMSHGYDAIVVPARLKAEYIEEIVGALRTGDLTSHIRFLLSRYDDQ